MASRAWADACELIDLQLSPLGLRAIERLELIGGEIVLDVGCGAGQTLLQLADRVGTKGQVIGVDIAAELLKIARQRSAKFDHVSLILADAQRLDLPTASVDVVFSRFGIMAFDDPVSAFTNFHRILRPSGGLGFTCWRSLEDNPLDNIPLLAAGLEGMVSNEPFSFADPDHLSAILQAAGFGAVSIQRHDETVSSGDLDAMTGVLLKVGPLGRIIRENPELRVVAEPRLRKALSALGNHSLVSLLAAVWIVTAKA